LVGAEQLDHRGVGRGELARDVLGQGQIGQRLPGFHLGGHRS
jgi:hypothetical protein